MILSLSFLSFYLSSSIAAGCFLTNNFGVIVYLISLLATLGESLDGYECLCVC